ncbi:g1856 [Coccomyxa elongata]
MPPERAAALLRGLSGTPGRLTFRQVTDKAAMLESYLQDAHNLSREASRCATIGASQHNIQDTPSASTSEAISPVHHAPALDCTAALPLQKHPTKQGGHSHSRSVRAGFSGPRWASGRAVLHDGDAAGSEWGGTPTVASSMKSRATAMYTSKTGYADMHLKRIAEQ